MERAFLLLGSNEGDRMTFLAKAIMAIIQKAGKSFACSSIYETAAWGKDGEPSFLNQVIGIVTSLTPEELLKTAQSIESDLGRIRTEKWSRRTIDIDILFYGSKIIETPDLIVPHPGIAQRKFTLVPLAEVAPHFMHPVLNKTMEELLRECHDTLAVGRIEFRI